MFQTCLGGYLTFLLLPVVDYKEGVVKNPGGIFSTDVNIKWIGCNGEMWGGGHFDVLY